MNEAQRKGRVTIPTDTNAVSETLQLMQRWAADAIRDCDGTEFPQQLQDTGAKIYATYYTTRKDNAWAKQNPDEMQQCYLMTPFYTAAEPTLEIPLMTGISAELMQVNDKEDIARWWEVMDRTTGQPLPAKAWRYNPITASVTVEAPTLYHEYTVSFLAYLIWDPVHMYNAVINNWQDVDHQIPFDVRQPKTHAYTLRRLHAYLESHPHVNVVRFTTFFHQFTLLFDELRREKYVDWYGYSASVCPHILAQFEQEVGYKFRPEFIIDQGYYNNQYRVPTKQYTDFMAFQRREVAALMRELTDIVHQYGKEAMMFLGDHWIGCHMVHHALYQKQNYSYAGVIEALSGAPFDVSFISFDEVKADPHLLDSIDVLVNVGDGDTAHTGGVLWEDATIASAIKGFVHRGGGLIGVGEPGGHQYQGRYLQLGGILGVEKETGFTLNYDKYNWQETCNHFILADDLQQEVTFGEGKADIYAAQGTTVLVQQNKGVQLAAHAYGKGRGVYISGLPYSFANSRLLHRAILWAAHAEQALNTWFSSNHNTEVHAFVKNGKYCVVNNTYQPQDTTVYTGNGESFALHLDANEIKWYSINAE